MNRSNRHLGFSLTELLVVIGIITVVAILAVPVFRAMTGSRSTEAAQNQLAGILGRARAEAIGLQQIRGVFFTRDAVTQRVQAMMVQETQRPTTLPPMTVSPDVYLDLVPDRDPVLMPTGVGIQVIDDTVVAAGPTASPYDDIRADDAYIGFNLSAGLNGLTPGFTYGGVILFDGYGRVVNRSYAFKFFKEVPSSPNVYSELAKFLDVKAAIASTKDFYPVSAKLAGTPPLRSQLGFVVFDQTLFADQGFTNGDQQVEDNDADNGANYAAKERAEEKWLDSNGVPVLVNRNNGSLVKGE